MRERMGDGAFATFAIAKLRHVAAKLPLQHPLYHDRVMTKGSPEHEWAVDSYMVLAILPELEATGDERAVEVLQALVSLRQVQVGDAVLSYGSHTFYRRARKAYLSIALEHTEPLALIRDRLEDWGWQADLVDAVSDGARWYGDIYPDEAIVPFLKWYAGWSLWQAPAAGGQLASELRGVLMMRLDQLLDLAVDVHSAEALLMLLIAAHDHRLDDPVRAGDALDRWRQLVTITWEQRLAAWEAQPLAEHRWRGVEVARLKHIVHIRPDPTFKPLILRTARLPLLSSYSMVQLLEPYELTEEELASIHDRLTSPTLVPKQRVALLKLLMALDYRPVVGDVEAFIKRYHLKATKRHGDAATIRYPLLGIDSDAVYDWELWLQDPAKRP